MPRVRICLLTGLLLLTANCASSPSQPSSRRHAELRHAIDAERSFNPHCWCRAYEGTFRRAEARAPLHLSPSDIPVLASLLDDTDLQIFMGALDLLVSFGPSAVPDLQQFICRPRSADVERSFRQSLARDRLSTVARDNGFPPPTCHE